MHFCLVDFTCFPPCILCLKFPAFRDLGIGLVFSPDFPRNRKIENACNSHVIRGCNVVEIATANSLPALRPVSTTSVEKSILCLFYCFFCARFNRRSIKETKNALFHARSGNGPIGNGLLVQCFPNGVP